MQCAIYTVGSLFVSREIRAGGHRAQALTEAQKQSQLTHAARRKRGLSGRRPENCSVMVWAALHHCPNSTIFVTGFPRISPCCQTAMPRQAQAASGSHSAAGADLGTDC